MSREWLRTIVLVVLIAIGIGFLVWTKHAADTGLLQGIGR
jgi:hypothetical protein